MQKSYSMFLNSSKKILANCQVGTFKDLPHPKWPTIREVGCPIIGKSPALKNVKNAFDVIKSGAFLF